MILDTPRLSVLPLTYEQLLLYVQPGHVLEKSLQLNVGGRTVSPALQEAFEQSIMPAVADTSKNYLFSTLWTVVLKTENMMIGDLCFQGEPNEKGEIEIGYGTYDHFQNKGYMTEAVGALVRWGLGQERVLAVVAETNADNIPSQKILKNNGFHCLGQAGENLKWRKEKG